MAYSITLPLPEKWTSETDIFENEEGGTVTHMECHLPGVGLNEDGFIDISVGAMPEDTTAADQALSNYAEMVGFDDDDEEDPIVEWKFNNRKAFGFEAYMEDESPIRVMCIEIKQGILAIISVIAKDEQNLSDLLIYIEKNLRIK